MLRPVVRTDEFDQAITELLERGLIVAERPMLYWHSPRGKDIPYRATVYKLARRPRQKAKEKK